MFARPLSIIAHLLLVFLATTVAAQPQQQEYHVRQEAEEGLLIRIDGVEADYRAVLSGSDGEQLFVSAMPGERLAPRFQYLPPTRTARDLVLEILPTAGTDRSQFDIGLSRLLVRDERSARLGQAYRALSNAQQEDSADSPAGWTVKVYGLDQAAASFESFGMEALRGWSRYCAAWFVLHRLGDINTTLDRGNALLADLAGGRQAATRLATLALIADSLSRQNEVADGDVAVNAWNEVAREAEAQDMHYEQAHALAEMARELASRGQVELAVERYQAALDIADRIGAGDLGTQVREALLPILGQQGDASASGEMLGQIESQLADVGDTDELARNLLAQGELANRTFRPWRALAPLEQALELERNSLIRSQAQLELAQALFALGRLEEAGAQARAAVTDPASRSYRRASPALDVRAGIDLLAATHRVRGEADELQEVREAQARWLGERGQDAAWWYQRGMDDEAMAPGAGGRYYARAANAPDPGAWRELGRLQACGLGSLTAGECVNSSLQNLYGRLRDGGVPAQAMEARLAWSRWQSRTADRAGAIATMAGLAEQAVFFREALPGVLDGWLLQRMPALETDYLAPLVRAGNGFDALLALARLRRLAGVPGRAGDLADDNFRALLARSAQGGDAATAAEIQARLAADYQTHARAHPDQTAAGLRQWLASLGGDQALLTWHIADTTATAWVARGDNVRMVRLDDAGGTAALAARAREQLPILEGPAFDALTAQLGERLLGPIAEHLPQRLLVAPAGPLLGLPLDALRVNERYLVERSEITQLLTFPSSGGAAMPAGGGVFVAGAPVNYSPEFPLGLDLPAGLRAVMSAFVGPDLYVVQGGALLLDEFDTPEYAQARVVHLELPGQIDLVRPQRSTLELSEPIRGAGRQHIGAADITARPLAAGLVWMGSTQVTGRPAQAISTWLPLVGEWFGAGAGQVIVSAWPMAEASSAKFLRTFYQGVEAGGTVPGALRAARLELMRDTGDGSRDWAAPLLFSD